MQIEMTDGRQYAKIGFVFAALFIMAMTITGIAIAEKGDIVVDGNILEEYIENTEYVFDHNPTDLYTDSRIEIINGGMYFADKCTICFGDDPHLAFLKVYYYPLTDCKNENSKIEVSSYANQVVIIKKINNQFMVTWETEDDTILVKKDEEVLLSYQEILNTKTGKIYLKSTGGTLSDGQNPEYFGFAIGEEFPKY